MTQISKKQTGLDILERVLEVYCDLEVDFWSLKVKAWSLKTD